MHNKRQASGVHSTPLAAQQTRHHMVVQLSTKHATKGVATDPSPGHCNSAQYTVSLSVTVTTAEPTDV